MPRNRPLKRGEFLFNVWVLYLIIDKLSKRRTKCGRWSRGEGGEELGGAAYLASSNCLRPASAAATSLIAEGLMLTILPRASPRAFRYWINSAPSSRSNPYLRGVGPSLAWLLRSLVLIFPPLLSRRSRTTQASSNNRLKVASNMFAHLSQSIMLSRFFKMRKYYVTQ